MAVAFAFDDVPDVPALPKPADSFAKTCQPCGRNGDRVKNLSHAKRGSQAENKEIPLAIRNHLPIVDYHFERRPDEREKILL
ncbi:MAG: hypothetical protein ACE5G1_13740 [bacterium]